MKLIDKLAHEYALNQVPWLADEINQPPTHESLYVNMVNDFKGGFIIAINLASERAECCEGAVVDLGLYQVGASVDKDSILNILNEEE